MRKYRSLIIALILLGITVGAGYYLYRTERHRQSTLRDSEVPALDPTASVLSKGEAPGLPVKLYLYKPGRTDPGSDFLAAEERTIFETDDVVLKARQVVNEVLKTRRVFSEEARLRQIYLLRDGTAVVDLSGQTATQLRGGVTSELAAILSITRSLRENIEQIKRVRFLVNGEESETFGGHVSIKEAFM